MKKKVLFALALAATLAMTACGGAKKTETTVAATTEKASEKASESASENATEAAKEDGEKTEVQVFVAASLKNVMEDLGQQYEKEHPEVKLVSVSYTHLAYGRKRTGAVPQPGKHSGSC